jgi:hypothetical protein
MGDPKIMEIPHPAINQLPQPAHPGLSLPAMETLRDLDGIAVGFTEILKLGRTLDVFDPGKRKKPSVERARSVVARRLCLR